MVFVAKANCFSRYFSALTCGDVSWLRVHEGLAGGGGGLFKRTQRARNGLRYEEEKLNGYEKLNWIFSPWNRLSDTNNRRKRQRSKMTGLYHEPVETHQFHAFINSGCTKRAAAN